MDVFYYPGVNKYVYFFIVPYLVIFWLILNSVKFLWGKWGKLFFYLIVMMLGWVFYITLFSLVVSIEYAVLATFLMRTIFAPVFMHLAIFNHIGLDEPKKRLSWIPHQTKTTRNLKGNWFLKGIGGNAFVECHLEHHLFPNISNKMLAKIRPIVKRYLERKGYMYTDEGYFKVLSRCLKDYDKTF